MKLRIEVLRKFVIAILLVGFISCKTKILLFGPLPTGLDKMSESRIKYNKIHELFQHLGNKKQVHYYNMIEAFSDENGGLNENYYRSDG